MVDNLYASRYKKDIEKAKNIIESFDTVNYRVSIGIVGLDGQVIRCRYLGGELTDKEPSIFIPLKLERLLYPKRYKIVFGGRSSAKTRTFSSLVAEYIRAYNKKILCCREIFHSIRESSHRSIANEIDRRSLRSKEVNISNIDISSMQGRGIATFARLKDNPETIKGNEGVDIVWVDEAENISLMSWTVLRPTIRKDGSEIWISFNPRFKTDPTWTEFVEPFVDKMTNGIYEDDKYLIISINHCDNPWLTNEAKYDMQQMKERDYDRYLWQWEGQFNNRSNSQIFHAKWEVQEFESLPHWEGPYFGADFGFANDPSTLIRMWLHDETLYIDHEVAGVGIDLDDMPDFYDRIPGARDSHIYADCSRPETISHLYNKGFSITGADKWPGSIEDGITWIRGLKKVVIHPRCIETANEFELYSYKLDRLTDEPLPVPNDKYNHCIDAIRYALVDMIKYKTSIWD